MHQPVLASEAVGYLNLEKGDTILDATTGLGGHAKEILKAISPGGRLIGIDADETALKIAESNLEAFSESFSLVNGNFRDLDAILSKESVKTLNGALFDIGVSSLQMDSPGRGFSIKNNAPLDMRMDQKLAMTAYNIVNKYDERELSEIIKKYGEERFHNRVARYIVERRLERPVETTHELAGIVYRAIGYKYKRSRIDPATRTFQAIRIAVNDELGSLEEGLKKAVSWLDIGSRICVISFHSLEDRIVKNLFKGYAALGVLKIITKKPVIASRAEIAANPRSRSAKLRVAERA